jgi:seryl-tRNA synthetase
MLTVNFIRENNERVRAGLAKRNFKQLDLLEAVLAADDRRKKIQQESDQTLAEGNRLSEEIGQLFRSGRRDEADAMKARATELREKGDQLRKQQEEARQEVLQLLLQIPNCPSEQVPTGVSADDNEVFKAWQAPLPELGAQAQPHWELIKRYDIIDFELGTKITGAGFPVYKGKGAKLQRALIAFFLDEAEKAGYLEIMPPHLVNADSARGTGQLPDKDDQMYFAPLDGLYLIPTAEVPVTNLYRDVILREEDFPIKMAGYTPCFRREAGSWGAHVRGLNRLHQFDKVEIVQIQHPERSYETLMEMVAHVEGLLEKLQLPYRILRLCGGDMGFSSALTFDFEVYSAAQQRWLEVSSVSNFESFQANRMQLRYRTKDKKTELAHTLNGSALALARIVAAILENNQTPEGILVPEALRPYTRFERID